MEIFDSFFERDTDPNSGIVWKLRGISSEDAQKFCHSLAQNPENKDMLESFLYTALFFMPDTQEFWYMRAILLLNPVNGLPRSYYYSQAMASLKHARTCDMYLFEETMDGINGWQDFLIGRARRDSPYLLHDKLYQPEEPKPNTSRRVAIRDGGYISSEDAEKACHSLVQKPENKDILGYFLYYALFFTPDFQELGLWQAMLLLTLRYDLLAMAYLNSARTLDKHIYERAPHDINELRALIRSKI